MKGKRHIIMLICAAVFSMAVFPLLAADVKSVQEITVTDKVGPTFSINGASVEFTTDITTKVEIFSITGQLVKSLTVNPGTTLRIELPKGFFIIKCEYWAKRVMVK